MFGLCDCNNFFVSCERVFNPSLNDKAVVVLSNNDGCVISRSNQAKALGIKMGQPYFQIKELEEQGKVVVFSSNYILYGDMSNRVMGTLSGMVEGVEIYSIDEAFIDFSSIKTEQLSDMGKSIAKKIHKNTGIPVSIGIAPTKTLAKIAAELCKNYPKLNGSCLLYKSEDIEKVLKKLPVSNVWGIGRKFNHKLQDMGVFTAYDFTCLPNSLVRSKFGVVGLRTWSELKGTACINFEHSVSAKQQICTSRSFATEINDIDELKSAVSMFTTMCAKKLRAQNSVCSELSVFIYTNRHKPELPQYYKHQIMLLESPSDSTLELVKLALSLLEKIYESGYGYKKVGVILSKIESANSRQLNLFDTIDRDKHKKLMSVMDNINSGSNRDLVSVASIDRSVVKMNRNHLSQAFTTRWDEIIKVKV